MATPQSPTIPGFEPDERSNCRATEFTSTDPEVVALPTLVLDDAVRTVLSRWKMTPQERLLAYLTGDVYLYTQTMGNPLQPLLVSFERPTIENEDGDGVDISASSQVPQFGVLFDVLQRRKDMDEVGGLRRYPPELRIAVLSRYLGRVAEAVIHQSSNKDDKPQLRRELVALTAVAMAWLEAIDDPEGEGAQAQFAFSGETDDVLRRMVQEKGAASVIESLSKAAYSESLNLAVSLGNLGHEHQARMDAAQKITDESQGGGE